MTPSPAEILQRIAILDELERRGVTITPEPVVVPILDPRRLVQGILDALRPEPKMTVTEWADSNRRLSSEASKEYGEYSSERVPYLKEIMDSLSPSSGVQIVVFMKGSQIGASEAAYNTIGCYIDCFPCPMMIFNPTDDDMRKNSQTRIAPMIEACPSLREKVSKAKSRSGSNSMLFKAGPGFILTMAGANSPSPFASTAGRLVIMDEYDRMPDNVGKEGSPLGLVAARTSTFGTQRKIFVLSTPTTSTSKIAALYDATDKRMYHVPCPHCQGLQVLEWENFVYTRKGEDDYHCTPFCIHCAAEMEEKHKTWMMDPANGAKWISTNPELESATKRGYHLSALYSPLGWLSWNQIAAKHDQAYNIKNDANLQTVFENTVLGRIYSQSQDRPAWENLHARAGEYSRNNLPKLPDTCEPGKPLFLTCGCDVQRDRLELEVVAWGMGRESWSVDYRVIYGNTESPSDACWQVLAATMRENWEVSGVRMPIAYTGIDSSDQTKVVTQVVTFLNSQGFRILPLKGKAEQMATIVSGGGMLVRTVNGKEQRYGKPLWHVGVSALKAELYGFLKLTENPDGSTPSGYCHFPDYTEGFFQMLTAEATVVEVDKHGYPQDVWKKLHPRNEALDCRNYARAVAEYRGMLNYGPEIMQTLRSQLATVAVNAPASQPPAPSPKPKAKPQRDRYDRGVY